MLPLSHPPHTRPPHTPLSHLPSPPCPQYSDEISKITNAAVKELTIESEIRKLTEVWREQKFELGKYMKGVEDRGWVLRQTEEVCACVHACAHGWTPQGGACCWQVHGGRACGTKGGCCATWVGSARSECDKPKPLYFLLKF